MNAVYNSIVLSFICFCLLWLFLWLLFICFI